VGVYQFSSNLPAPINVGPDPQTKTGNLIIEGVLRLGQFTTANAPSGTEGALYFDTTDNTTKLYSNSAWGDLGGGGEPGQLPTYTTAQRDALSPTAGLMIYNTDYDQVQTYTQTAWSGITGNKDLGIECASAMDCASGFCVDSVCCDTSLDNCSGNCHRCNIAGSMGICSNVNSLCTGNCDVCSSGTCIANATLCTGDCDVCSGSDMAYSCAASNALCSNTTASCGCSGSGTAYNCSSCPDTYGACGHPTCSSYVCGNTIYDDLTSCGSGNYCYSSVCTGAYCDEDNDGYYTTSKVACPSGRVRLAVGNDCEDSCATCFPGSTATTPQPDGLDQDCNNGIDNSLCVTGSNCGPRTCGAECSTGRRNCCQYQGGTCTYWSPCTMPPWDPCPCYGGYVYSTSCSPNTYH